MLSELFDADEDDDFDDWYVVHSFITSIYIAPLQVGLLRGAPNPNTTK